MTPARLLGPACLLGIVNATPDSFSDGGRSKLESVDHAMRLAAEGADMLDVGGESTRPGAAPVEEQAELDRVLPVIEALCARTPVPLSIDTRKPAVAAAAVAAGASVWNDVSALTYAADSLATAARLGVPVVLMHAQGDPQTMQDAPAYKDVVAEVLSFLHARIGAARGAGVASLVADPGIGFGKTLTHNLSLMRGLERFADLGVPLMMGASRKRFIAALDRDGPAHERVGGSLAAALRARQAGFAWFRVHDVAQTRQALAVWDAASR